MAIGDSALRTWECRPCGVRNVEDRDYCSNCHAARHRRPTAFERIAPMDLEEFCARQAKHGRVHAAIEQVGPEFYLTLTPPTDPPQVFLIANENGVVPCDNLGRASW